MFPETEKTVRGKFFAYWREHGGVAQQGYPISEEMSEVSQIDGKTYTLQYFERAVFELHPENPYPYDVLLSLLGTIQYKAKYGDEGGTNQKSSTDNPITFPQTGKSVGGRFRQYWEQQGGLGQQGYPISNEFEEISQIDGKGYVVQYFERAVFEYHPENVVPYDVLRSHLGRFRFEQQYVTCPGYLRLRGSTIAEGTAGAPSQYFKLTKYRVDEVTMSKAITCEVDIPHGPYGFEPQTRTFSKFYRVVVVGEAIPDLNSAMFIFLNDNLLAPLSGGIVYDRDLLLEGGTLGVGTLYGNRDYLPIKLHFN